MCDASCADGEAMTADAAGPRATAVGLILLAFLLAVPVPAMLARARWPARNPKLALVCWQAVGLAGGLSLLGAGLSLAASGPGRSLTDLGGLPARLPRAGVAVWAGLLLSCVTGLWLATVTVASAGRVVAARRAHRARLELIARGWPGPPGRDGPPGAGTAAAHPPLSSAGVLRLVDSPVPVAYCLPGLRPRIVVSQGAVAALSASQLTAVLAHERAHARGRHDLIIQPFVAWRQAFPFLPPAGWALQSVELLAEMLADDAACRCCGIQPLRGALRRLGDERLDLGAGDSRAVMAELDRRVARLTDPRGPLPRLAAAGLYLAAAALVLLPMALIALA